jgi:LAGLIDADG DNA endonuclease family protein
VGEHPIRVRRRLIPDEAQLQIILGSLLGGARIEGAPGARCMRVVHEIARESYVWWKYERLGGLADDAPRIGEEGVSFTTIAHPLFDDLAPVTPQRRETLRRLLAPLGLAVWMSDAGRLELRAEVFVPYRRAA